MVFGEDNTPRKPLRAEMFTQMTMGKILKGLYSAVMACLGSLATVLGDNVTLSDLTAGQWVTIAAFTLGAFGGTYGLSGWAGPGILAEKSPPSSGG
jgi:hypothetical protein